MTDVVLHAPFAGWLSMLDEVPDPVFAEGMMGEGLAIDPIEGLVRAPADAEVIAVPASAHAVTLRLGNGAELLIHVGLETVALAGEGFSARVRAGDRVRTGDPLIAFDLDAVARRAKDLVTPVVASSDGATMMLERAGRLVAAGEVIGSVRTSAVASAQPTLDTAAQATLTVIAPHGLHARPAARLGSLVKRFDAAVTLRHGGRSADARSIASLLALGAKRGDTLLVEARGREAAAVVAAVLALAAERFGDPEGDTPAATPASDGPVTAAPGLAIGQARQYRAARVEVLEHEGEPDAEAAALDAALAAVAAAQRGPLADAHRALVEDPALLTGARARIAEGYAAAWSWRAATQAAAAAIRATGDALLAERVADLDDVERQVIARLTGTAPVPSLALAPGTILIAEDLLPSEFQAIDRAALEGIVTAAGGPTSHVAILAASAGVPMLVAAGRGVLGIADGTTVVLDADRASIEVEPSSDVIADATARLETQRNVRAAAASAAHQLCVTADGVRIEVFANLGSVEDAAFAVAAGAEGCGLLRTEFLFLDRETAPDEAEQRALYAHIASALGSRPLIVRTLDIGGDKPVPYLPQAAEDNPALGLRGIRLGLARPDLLAIQLRAILAGVPGAQCRVMLPMITDLAELRAVRAMLDEARVAVGRADPVQLGVMIETPAAALLADQLAGEADFFSIGTNDLTQYALACDRGNAAVSAKVDALHPAVLRLIAQAAAGAVARGRPVGVCGGLASDPLAAPVLIGLSVTELSATPAAMPMVKAAVRAVTMADCRALAARALAATSAAEVRALLGAAA